MRSNLRIGGSSSTTSTLSGGGVHAAVSNRSVALGTGSVMVKTAPGRSDRFAAIDGAAHGLDKAAGDGKPKPGAGANLVSLGGAMKLLEHMLDLLRRNAAALIDDLQLDRAPLLPAFDAYRRLGRRIFGGVVEEIEQHLLEQHRIELEHRQVGRNLDLHCVPRQNLARRAPATEPTISPTS